MRSTLLAPILALALFSQGCIIVDGGDSTLTVSNDSSYVIEELYVSPIDAFTWGRDLLGNDPLFPNDSITIELDCDVYDVLVVDEFGAECVLAEIDLCFDDAFWDISNATLSICDAFGSV